MTLALALGLIIKYLVFDDKGDPEDQDMVMTNEQSYLDHHVSTTEVSSSSLLDQSTDNGNMHSKLKMYFSHEIYS